MKRYSIVNTGDPTRLSHTYPTIDSAQAQLETLLPGAWEVREVTIGPVVEPEQWEEMWLVIFKDLSVRTYTSRAAAFSTGYSLLSYVHIAIERNGRGEKMKVLKDE